jgi:hypothetical protein
MSLVSREPSPALASYADLAERVAELREALERLAGSEDLEAIPDQAVRSLLTMGVQLYYAKRASGAKFPPLSEADVTASEVAVAVADMVKAVQIELFEVALWNSFGRP